VVVAPGYRGQGTGRRLVEAVTGTDPGITWVLRAGRAQAPQFFAKLGFVASEEAMERRRACGT
jgi:N-acetylglutamate synthase-like GNAT family acetyltransferase